MFLLAFCTGRMQFTPSPKSKDQFGSKRKNHKNTTLFIYNRHTSFTLLGDLTECLWCASTVLGKLLYQQNKQKRNINELVSKIII